MTNLISNSIYKNIKKYCLYYKNNIMNLKLLKLFLIFLVSKKINLSS